MEPKILYHARLMTQPGRPLHIAQRHSEQKLFQLHRDVLQFESWRGNPKEMLRCTAHKGRGSLWHMDTEGHGVRHTGLSAQSD